MFLKALTCELLKNARPQVLDNEDGLCADQPFDLIGYGNQMGHYFKLGRFQDPNSFYIESFGDFHSHKLDIDAIKDKKAWNPIWNNVYYNDKGEKIILSIVYEDDKFNFTKYNKHSDKDGQFILRYIWEMYRPTPPDSDDSD
jgi:hypothetical protein